MADEAPEHHGLALLKRAEAAMLSKGTKKSNSVLIMEMSVLIVQQAEMIAALQEKLADKPRILVPELTIHG